MVSKQAQFHGSLCSRPPDHPARVVTNPETGRRLLIHEQRILTGEAIMASTATSRHGGVTRGEYEGGPRQMYFLASYPVWSMLI